MAFARLVGGSLYAALRALVGVEIISRTDVLHSTPFGNAGPYERIKGKVRFALPVVNRHNLRIVDLSNAVNLINGEVEFSSDFIAIRPKDAQKGNGSMILEVPNRGRARILTLVDGGDWDLADDAGDAWLLRNGFTIVTLGWQWDAAGADPFGFYAPVAKEKGKPSPGCCAATLCLRRFCRKFRLGHLIVGEIGGSEYPVAAPDDPRNVLTVRDSRDAPRTPTPTLRVAICPHGRRQTRAQRSAYSPQRQFSARQDLRVCVCRC